MTKQNQAEQIANTVLSHLKKYKQINLILNVIYILKNSPEYKAAKNHCEITSPYALSSEEVNVINNYLNRTIEGDYDLKQTIDPALVGGFTLQVNDMFIDASILGKIDTISHNFSKKD